MVTRRSQHAVDLAATIEEQLGRLIAANETLQEELARHLAAEQEWQAERTLLRAMIDQVPDYLFVKDTESRFVIANKAVAADLGKKPEEIIGKTDFELHPPERAEKFFADEQNVVRSGEPMLDIEEYIIDAPAQRNSCRPRKCRCATNGTRSSVSSASPATSPRRKEAEDEVHFLAHHDALTRLPNRTLLTDRLGQAILQSAAQRPLGDGRCSSISTISSSSTTALATAPATNS